MPTILDSLFHKEVNTTSSPIRVEGGGWWVVMKWQLFLFKKLKNYMAKWHRFRLPHALQNVATSMPSVIS